MKIVKIMSVLVALFAVYVGINATEGQSLAIGLISLSALVYIAASFAGKGGQGNSKNDGGYLATTSSDSSSSGCDGGGADGGC